MDLNHALFIVLILMALVDLWSTRKVLQAGGREANPVMRWLMKQMGTDAALAVSRVIPIAAGVALLPLAWFYMAALAAIYTAVVANNLRVLKSMRKG